MATAPDPKVDPTRVDPTRARRTGEKSAEAFRTISEVAQELDLPQHVLRFWETKFTHIRPMKRGGGRRYYRPEDIVLLRGIRDLLYDDGYTIKGVQKLLREGGVRVLQDRAGTAGGDHADGAAPAAEPELNLEVAAAEQAAAPAPDPEPAGAPSGDRVLDSLLADLQAIRRILDEGRG